MNVKPLSDRVLVRPMSKSEVTDSGIVIPDTVSKERPEKGEIIAVGPGRAMDDGSVKQMSVKVGDKVMFKKYGPDEIKVDNEDLLILEESDLIALIED